MYTVLHRSDSNVFREIKYHLFDLFRVSYVTLAERLGYGRYVT